MPKDNQSTRTRPRTASEAVDEADSDDNYELTESENQEEDDEDLFGGEDAVPEDFDDIGIDPFASDRVVAAPSLLPFGRRKPPPIAELDDALARARYENGHDRERMEKITYFIVKFHKGVAKGKQNTFANNNHLRDVRKRCRKARQEYLDTGVINHELVPSNEELLAMRYCAPRGEVNATIGGMLAEMGLLNLAQAPMHGMAQSDTEDKDTANNSHSLPHERDGKEIENNHTIDDMTRLKAEVWALNKQMEELIAKGLVTLDDADHLAQKAKAKMGQQREAAEKMNADLEKQVAAAGKKHDELDKHVKGEVAAKITAAGKKQDALDKHVKGELASLTKYFKDELASLNAKYTAQQKQMGDLAKKVEKPAAPFSSTQLKSAQEPPSGFPQSSLPQPGLQNPRLAQSVSSSSAQKRNWNSLDSVESPKSKRSAGTVAEQASRPQSLHQSGRVRATKAGQDKPAPAKPSIRSFSFDE